MYSTTLTLLFSFVREKKKIHKHSTKFGASPEPVFNLFFEYDPQICTRQASGDNHAVAVSLFRWLFTEGHDSLQMCASAREKKAVLCETVAVDWDKRKHEAGEDD